MPRLEEPGRGQPRGGAPGEAGSPPRGGGQESAEARQNARDAFSWQVAPSDRPGSPLGGGGGPGT